MEDKQLDYVISACGMMGVFAPDHATPWFPLYKRATLSLMKSLNKRIAQTCKNSKPLVSALYNAYTEKGHIDHMNMLDNLGAHSVYADSGGLQIVTAGKSITEDVKQQIYKTQTYADYAMCFDVIPLSSVSLTRTRNERSNVGNKIFHSVNLDESADATANNIKSQVKFFRENNAKTKVIIIVQGNSSSDMINFFERIQNILSEEDYDNIGGLAIADTCMGNGELESIEMLIAAKKISEICHDNVKRHLHVLGVGSIARMRPIIYLLKSKYLDAFNRVSYDSSSHTSTFQYGLLKVDGTCRSIGSYKTQMVDDHFRSVYRLFEDTFSEYVSEDQFINNVFADGMGDWKYSTIKNRIMTSDNEDAIVSTLLCNAAYTYFQIHNFVTNIDRLFSDVHGEKDENDKKWNLHINNLLCVENDEDMNNWIRDISTSVKSKRIDRDTKMGTLDGLFL